MRFNGEWLAKLSFADVVRLTRTTTVARLLERDDFARRYAASEPISVSELLYPLMQAYDSVAIQADVELGGTDQLYNLLAGREVMQAYGLEPQVAMTTPLLLSWDGQKMSSSVGNNIPLTAPPDEQFGRTMRIPDTLLADWYRLVAEAPLPAGEPMEAKLALARWIVGRSHGEEAARRGRGALHPGRSPAASAGGGAGVRLVASGGAAIHLPSVMVDHMGIASTSEARRLIEQGGVKLDGEPVTETEIDPDRLDGALLQVGKRRFVRVSVESGHS